MLEGYFAQLRTFMRTLKGSDVEVVPEWPESMQRRRERYVDALYTMQDTMNVYAVHKSMCEYRHFSSNFKC